MTGLKLYGVKQSTNVMRALVCLYEKGLDFEFVSVDMHSGEHKKDPFISFNRINLKPLVGWENKRGIEMDKGE
ncbi:Glutathione S-transferase PARB [Acorus calamus]|uniref:glutathione transferase n=1 Tax=Acorus calamus TaxID=4465 RepID=A0AAV9CSM0_ACOCL|nr:Glutathione S-transferase PARB [Acorus calamus]